LLSLAELTVQKEGFRLVSPKRAHQMMVGLVYLPFSNENINNELMEQVGPMDKVQIIQVNPGEEQFLNKVGQVIIVVDDDKYLVSFSDGTSAAFRLEQLKKAQR
jgi:hypothetical protein